MIVLRLTSLWFRYVTDLVLQQVFEGNTQKAKLGSGEKNLIITYDSNFASKPLFYYIIPLLMHKFFFLNIFWLEFFYLSEYTNLF